MIALTLALLARLAHQDSWRDVATPSIEEGWLNILLPLAWSLLIALVILEDPPVGEAPFWGNRPLSQAFAANRKGPFRGRVHSHPVLYRVRVHCECQGLRTHRLSGYPARKATRAAGAHIASHRIGYGGRQRDAVHDRCDRTDRCHCGSLSSSSAGMDSPAIHRLRETLVLLSLTSIISLRVAIAQYGPGHNSATRQLGITVIWVAVLIWWSPRPKFEALLQAFLSPASPAIGQPSIHLSSPNEPHERLQGFPLAGQRSDDIRAAIPVVVSGFTPGYSAHFGQKGMQWETPEGPYFGALAALQEYPLDIPTWQLLSIDKKIFDQVKDTPIDLEGTATAAYYRLPEPVWTSVDKNITIAGLGKCSTEIVGDDPNDQMLKVGCESPNRLPVVRLRLLDAATNREWKQTLGGSALFQDYPTTTWLSPVDRRVTYFPLIDEELVTENLLRWQIPREIVQSLKIAIIPEFPAGSGVLHYQLPDIKLSQYRVEP